MKAVDLVNADVCLVRCHQVASNNCTEFPLYPIIIGQP